MAIELIVTASAQLEIDDAVLWYDAINSDIADNLLFKIDIAYSQIERHPLAWPAYAETYRHCAIDKFPYSIIYHYVGNRIEVLAFAHHKRKPLYWLEINRP